MEAPAREGQLHKRVRTRDSEEESAPPPPTSYCAAVTGWRIGFQLLCKRLHSLWHPQGQMQVVDLDFDYFLVRFKAEEDCLVALTQGPWVIFRHILSVQPWQPSFRPSYELVTRVVVWVRVLNLPITRYHPQILTAVGNLVGNTVRIDIAIIQKARGKYARLIVDVDLASPLRHNVILDGETLLLAYEGLPQICFDYGRIGHAAQTCPQTASTPPEANLGAGTTAKPVAPAPPIGTQATTSSPNGYGEWMQVTRRGAWAVKNRGDMQGRDRVFTSGRLEVLSAGVSGFPGWSASDHYSGPTCASPFQPLAIYFLQGHDFQRQAA
ncbi:hypothetical protein K2173_018605 [Erythroxylum novogranatense]|uniref:DUF4283 domain-containing protein n=1 Tax=Erythroxylum novogranatense TaxID=1862640 RepID=A0AAV8UB68_9ROSI|nr:hypothetical protein K2173_018605 [Erythroxylum novogranatense]